MKLTEKIQNVIERTIYCSKILLTLCIFIEASRRLIINSREVIINFNQSVVIDASEPVVTFNNEHEKITRL